MKSLLHNIGDYQIIEKLGRGGMADVYLAVNSKDNRRVALKLVERGEGTEAQEILEAERLGAELQQRISLVDPRVPQIHSFGDLDGYFYIEMEFVEGNDLSRLIESSTLKPEQAAGIALELCGILHNAHGMSLQIEGRELRAIVHGDIKPKNIRIDLNGGVRVLDFGIAKGLSITRRLTSNVFGSVAYSSPERLESGSIDEMSDLWSIGIVLYEMLEQRLPFEAPSTERLETIIRSRSAMRPLQDSCPPALQQIVYKSLASSPGSRYQNATEFGSDLESFLSGKETLAGQENEQTRRTVPLEEDLETRRTPATSQELEDAAVAVPQESKPFAVSVQERPFDLLVKKIKARLIRSRKWILAGSLAFLVIMGSWEGLAIHAATQVKPDFIQGRMDPDSGWVKYQDIKKRSLLGIAPMVLQAPLRDILTENSERIFSAYRNSDTLRVREGDWIRCRRYMSRAAQLGISDRKTEAMLEYASGQISRINRKDFDAIASFQRASSLQPKWPDPYIGLARTYIYNLGDMDRGTQALERAQDLGYSFGKRELGMMAEAHRKRGLQDLENADTVRGTDQEKEFLKKAKSEFEEALKVYLEIAPWGDSTTQILSVQDSLGETQRKLDELNKPSSLLPWNWFK